MRLFWLWRIVPLLTGITIGFILSVSLRLLLRPSKCEQGFLAHRNEKSERLNSFKRSFGNFVEGDDEFGTDDGERVIEAVTTNFPDILKKTESPKVRQLLFVGVMTAQKYLDNRVLGVFETWAQEVPGKVVFFTGENDSLPESGTSLNNTRERAFELVTLPGVDDSYPPQKKSFTMLQYMHDKYGDQFEWFMRADDDVYVKADKLAALLRSINSKLLYFIGQAGRGNAAEKGTLSLANNENYCMGGPGIILSHVALAKVAPFIPNCLQALYSAHEDVEVGRCVQKFAGISCTWAHEMQYVFYHNRSGAQAFTDSLKSREVHRAITLHPIKDYQHMYRLHSYILGRKVQDLLYSLLKLQREWVALSGYLNESAGSNNSAATGDNREAGSIYDAHIYGLSPSLQKFKPREQNGIIPWLFLDKGVYSMNNLNPKQKVDGALKEGVEDIIRDVMDHINSYSRSRGRIMEFKELLYGYHRVSPLHGEDIVLDILLTYKKYRGKKTTVPVRRHAYIQRAFSPLELRLVPPPSHIVGDVDPSQIVPPAKILRKKLVLILPLSGRLNTLDRFLGNFHEVCTSWTSKFSLLLLISYFDASSGMENRARFFSVINSFRESTKSQKTCNVKVVQFESEFARGVALEAGISQCSDNDLLFLIDVDIRFTVASLERVILNTIPRQQVYYPIVFSQYNPEFLEKVYEYDPTLSQQPEISDSRGYWRDFGFGIVAFYKFDFRRAGGFDKTIKGWGREDVSLFERFVDATNLTIFRSPDPDLVHVYHAIFCNSSLPAVQYEMCQGTLANSFGSERTLVKYLLSRRPNILNPVINI